MVHIQLNLTDEEDRIVNLYKADKRLKTKDIAIRTMIREFTTKVPGFPLNRL